MSLSNIPKQIEARLPNNLSSVPWTRSLAAGGAVALLEDPEGVRRFWNDIPSYVQAGQRMLARFEGVIEQVSEQGVSLKEVLKRATDRI